jgi:transposase InsO family protein
MPRALGVSRSGYYKWLKTNKIRQSVYEEKLAAIERVFQDSDKTYGSPRISVEIKKAGRSLSKTTVARIMKANKLKVVPHRKFIHTTDSNHDFTVSKNLLKRNFTVDAPKKVWVSDITYIPYNNKFCYLTMFMDLYDRAIVGWSLSKDMSTENTTIKALQNALKNRSIDEGQHLLVHSDRGVQYASKEFRNLLKEKKCIQSMSRKGNCWDNAVAESFFKSIKSEKLDRYHIGSYEEAFTLVFRYIDGWYNTKRIHSALNGLSPIEYFFKNIVNLAA